MRLAVLCLVASVAAARETFWVCEAKDAEFKGTYVADDDREVEKAPVFTNEHGKNLFRHGPFWYFGDLEAWPPKSTYRCVLDCPMNKPLPPVGAAFTATKEGVEPVPVISATPCGSDAGADDEAEL